MQEVVNYILTIPRLYPDGQDCGTITYFNYGNTTTYYTSIIAFKQSLTGAREGRHETFITKSIIKGYLFDDDKQIFYDCNFTTNTFCMWINLCQSDIKSWLKPRNKLYNSKWLHSGENIVARLYRLVLFTQSKYYVYQQNSSVRYGLDYHDYENECSCQHQHDSERGCADSGICLHDCQHDNSCNCHEGKKVIFTYYTDMIQYQKITSSSVRLYYYKVYDNWTGTNHYDSHLFNNNDKILHKIITVDNQLGEREFYECSVNDDKDHGISRVWANLDNKTFRKWTQWLCVPMNEYRRNLQYIGSYHKGREHGISYNYLPTNGKSLHYHGNLCYEVNYDRSDNIRHVTQKDERKSYWWYTNYNEGVVESRTLVYQGNKVTNGYITMYLGLYFLCRDNYVICHDNTTNRFLSYFDKLPPEIGELILSKLTGHNQIKINKTFTHIGINLLYPPV